MHQALVASFLLIFITNSFAWSGDGHSAIGILAMDQLSPEVGEALEQVIGPLAEQDLVKACNWPDDVRKTDEWAWSAPQHYINLPRGVNEYLHDRDCGDGLCATEAIKTYAVQVFDHNLGQEKRWQAFAWLCHVTGDLHQPMHAAFADDRGGNNYEVEYKGEQINLHGFWDHELIEEFAGSYRELVALLSTGASQPASAEWRVESVDLWTNDSHRYATQDAYPPTRVIDKTFALKSWLLAQQQIELAATRLAEILNTEFKRSGD